MKKNINKEDKYYIVSEIKTQSINNILDFNYETPKIMFIKYIEQNGVEKFITVDLNKEHTFTEDEYLCLKAYAYITGLKFNFETINFMLADLPTKVGNFFKSMKTVKDYAKFLVDNRIVCFNNEETMGFDVSKACKTVEKELLELNYKETPYGIICIIPKDN